MFADEKEIIEAISVLSSVKGAVKIGDIASSIGNDKDEDEGFEIEEVIKLEGFA